MLHLILQSIDGMGSPAHLLYQYMQGFILPNHVVYEEMVLNMETHEQVINHGRTVNDMAKHLSSIEARCVVIFITNHSDENRRDLFV